MPRKPPKPDAGVVHEPVDPAPPVEANGINDELLNQLVEAVEEKQQAIKDRMAEARADCQPLRDEIDDLITEAAENKMPKRSFRAVLTRRRKLREADEVRVALNDAAKAAFDEMTAKLRRVASDLGPLGEAALHAHEAGAPA